MVLGLCFVDKGKFLENPYKLTANFQELFPEEDHPKQSDSSELSVQDSKSSGDDSDKQESGNSSESDSGNDLNDLVEVIKKGDPYLDPTLVDDDSIDENRIMSDDNVVIGASSGNGINTISVYIYNKKSTDFYLHHEILMDNEATCIDWMDYDPGQGNSNQPSNVLAVGTFENHIELWDLDIINTVEPIFTIGAKSDDLKIHRHKDSISCIKWNKHSRNILATGSMDHSVMLWDLSAEGKRVRKYSSKKGIIRSIAWHPTQVEPLLVLSAENNVSVFDCRYKHNALSINMDNPAESILWNISNSFCFFVGGEDGELAYYDIRTQACVFKCSAHHESIAEMCSLFGLGQNLVTCGEDNIIKLWDVSTTTPVSVYQKKIKGSVTAVSSCGDECGVFSYGGFNEDIKILDFSLLNEVKTHFNLS